MFYHWEVYLCNPHASKWSIRWKMEISAISCRAGTFTEQSARIILNIHKLRDITSRVKEEERCIKTGITLPTRSCSYSDDDMTKYATLIFSNPDGRSVLSHNRYILASDLATIARKAWISHAILNGVTDILQMNTKHTSVLMLNDVLMSGNDDLISFQENCQDHLNELFLWWMFEGQNPATYILAPWIALVATGHNFLSIWSPASGINAIPAAGAHHRT